MRFTSGNLLVSGGIEEHVAKLRRRVFGTVRRWKTHDQHDRFFAERLLGLLQKINRVIGDQVWVVVLRQIKSAHYKEPGGGYITHLCVVVAVFDAFAVDID